MTEKFSSQQYDLMLENLFKRFPSFQKDGASAYKPGIANMEFIDQLMGHPHRNYKIVHVAGTNGKGSVSNMMTSALAACGLKVGLYTSPHILDFRERMRVVSEEGTEKPDASLHSLVPKKYVWDFINKWQDTFDHFDLSFFEITTMLALQWFADEKVDMVVLETGLGGRLDSTNIVTPVLSVITNIGLDHCDMLGETLPEIAFEKAGIIKPRVPVVVGESNPETDSVFERKVLYTNLPEPSFMGNRNAIMSLLTYADKVKPTLWPEHEDILAHMDLQGAYQRNNLRTALAALDVLADTCHDIAGKSWQVPSSKVGSATLYEEKCARSLRNAIISTAKRTGFRGRWEKLSDKPLIICDIGHNEHGLRYNFSQLEQMKKSGKCSDLIVVYGSVADKDVDAVLSLMPRDAIYIFTQAHGKRALSAEKIREKFVASGCKARDVSVVAEVAEAVARAKEMVAGLSGNPLIYVGGSTYVVSEAIAAIQCRAN